MGLTNNKRAFQVHEMVLTRELGFGKFAAKGRRKFLSVIILLYFTDFKIEVSF